MRSLPSAAKLRGVASVAGFLSRRGPERKQEQMKTGLVYALLSFISSCLLEKACNANSKIATTRTRPDSVRLSAGIRDEPHSSNESA